MRQLTVGRVQLLPMSLRAEQLPLVPGAVWMETAMRQQVGFWFKESNATQSNKGKYPV